MNTAKKLHSVVLASAALILFLILFSFMGSAATEQSYSSMKTYAYIPNYHDGNVSVIDTASNTVTANVSVGSVPHGITVSPDGTKVYVANAASSTVSVINTATNTVEATVPVENDPSGVAITPDGTKVYVTNCDSNTVSVINTATNTVTATVPVESGPFGIAVNPDGTEVYLVNINSAIVSIISTATNAVTDTVNVGEGEGDPVWLAVNPAGTKVYVTNQFSNTVSVIDTATNTVTATVNVENLPEGVVVDPSGTKVYVVNRDNNTVSIIDTASNTVTANVSVGSYPVGVAVTPDGKNVYVTNFASNNVSIIDTETSTVVGTVNVGNGPSALGQFIGSVPLPEPVLPVANFSAKPTSGKAPLTVSFTDQSTKEPTSWNWTFGDGANSTVQNPVHMYSKAGNYTVSLTVTNAAGNNTKTKTNYIKVTTPVKPVAAFSAKPTSGKAPLTVSFTDKSSGSPTKWKWIFGDGTSSTVKNPKHQYLQEGNYTVKMTATNAAGSNTTTKTNYIKVTTNTRPGLYSKNLKL